MGIANITNNILTDSGLDTSSFLTTSAAASTYLPLVGGTLTGALNGTSAVFSSSVTPTGITNNGIYYGKANASFPATSLGYFALKTNNLDGERGGLTVQVSNATSTFIDALTINYTGAATFSSSVTAAGFLGFNVGNTNGIIRRTTVNGSNGIRIQGNANDTISDTNAGASITVGGGIIGDTFEGNIILSAYGSIADNNRNQIIFQNRTGVNTIAETMRINHLGNVGIGTASPSVKLDVVGDIRTSTGILFGSDTAADNALDDYEEGTWTPTVTAENGSYTMIFSPRGSYTKIGRVVTLTYYFEVNNKGTGSGACILSSLPFASKSSSSGDTYVGSGIQNSSNTPNQIVLAQNSSSLYIYENTGDPITATLPNTGTITYIT